MRLVKFAMVAATLLSANAYADVLEPPSGNGELVLFVRDVNNGTRVYARGLGITINDVLSQSTTTSPSFSGPVQDFVYTLPSSVTEDSNLNSFLGGGAPGTTYVWTVMAADTLSDDSTGTRRFLTTSIIDLKQPGASIPDNGTLGGLWTNVDGMMHELNGSLPDSSGSSTGSNGLWGQTGSTYANGGDWFGAGFNNEVALGDSAKLYILSNSSDDSLGIGRAYQAVNLRLTTGGTLESVGGAPSVPIPAAFWLLGSALAGFAGVARRRRETDGVAAAA